MKRSVKQIINSGEMIERLNYLNGKTIRKNINQINSNFKSAEIAHRSLTCRAANK